jgi:hypothetical protein
MEMNMADYGEGYRDGKRLAALDQHRIVQDKERQIQLLLETLSQEKAETKRLREALREAIEEVEAWASYASPYFREKHDLEGTLADLRAKLGEGK